MLLISTSISQLVEGPWYATQTLSSLVTTFDSYASLFDAFLSYKKSSMSPSDYSFFIKTTGGITSMSNTSQTSSSSKVDPIPLGDKIAAFSLAISEAPLYSLPYLTKLLQIAASERRREAVQGLEALVELFSSVPLLWNADKFVPTKSNGLNSVIVAQFDRDTKSIYTNILRLLEVHTHDQLEHGRHTACRLLFKLLMSPHAAAYKQPTVITILVNKMGDPNRKLASRIAYYLEQAWIENSVDATGDVEQSINNAMTIILKQERKSTKRPRHKKKATEGNNEEDGCEKAAYRVIYYAMTLLTQLRLQRNNPMTLRIINIYGLLFDHFIIKPHDTLKETDKKRTISRKEKRREKKNTRPSQSYEFGRIAKLLLTGLARAIPFTIDKNNEHLKKITTPLASLAKTSDNLALVWQSLGLLRMLNQDIMKELTSRLDKSDELIKYKGTHVMLLVLVEKSLSSNNFSDQFIPLLKKLLSLRCIGVLHADPLPMIKRLIDLHKELQSALRLPDDDIQGQSLCLWELTFLSKHFKQGQQSNVTIVLNGKTIGINGMSEEMTDVDWLSAWSDLKYTAHPDLEYLKKEYGIDNLQNNMNKNKKNKPSMLERDADKIIEDEVDRMADDSDGMSELSEEEEEEEEDMNFDEDMDDIVEDDDMDNISDSDEEEIEEDIKDEKVSKRKQKSVFAPAPESDEDEEVVMARYSKSKKQRH